MKRIAQVIFPLALNKSFDYIIPDSYSLSIGMRVMVNFNNTRRIGVVNSLSDKSKFPKLKPILSTLETQVCLHQDHWRFAENLAKIYPYYSINEFLFMMLPGYLKARNQPLPFPDFSREQPAGIEKKTICIKANDFITRYQSWKQIVREKLAVGSVLICFPQIAYLDEAAQVLRKDFSQELALIHSRQNDKTIFENWKKSRINSLILGTRVALFYYPADLSLLIVEDENNSSYFQEEKPFYYLPDAALQLQETKQIPLIFSSDYPALKTYHLIVAKKINFDDKNPEQKKIKIIDASIHQKGKIITPLLVELLRKSLTANKRIVLFWNKKGYANYLSCSSCKAGLLCDHCSGFLQMSLDFRQAICPYCGRKKEIPQICPVCNNGYLKNQGAGIEKISSLVKQIFPDIRINTWETRCADTQIIIATSKIVSSIYSSLEFDNGFVLDADSQLAHLNFETTFQTFIYLNKLASFFRENLYLFTRHINHYLFQNINGPWQNFYDAELKTRKELDLPPLKKIALINLRDAKENIVLRKTEQLYNKLKTIGLDTYGPFKNYPYKLRDKYRYFIIVKFKHRQNVETLINKGLAGMRGSTTKTTVIIKS